MVVVVGRFEVGRQLGRGVTGEVRLGTCGCDQKALKFVRRNTPEAVREGIARELRRRYFVYF